MALTANSTTVCVSRPTLVAVDPRGSLYQDKPLSIVVKMDSSPLYRDPQVIIPAFSGLIAAAALWFAGRQIRHARHQYLRDASWRRSTLFAEELRNLISNDEIDVICRVLDWRGGYVFLPERYKSLFENQSPITVSWDKFVQSVSVERPDFWMSDKESYVYRTCFDSFCGTLNQIYLDPRLRDDSDVPRNFPLFLAWRKELDRWLKHQKQNNKYLTYKDKARTIAIDDEYGRHLKSISFYCNRVINPKKEMNKSINTGPGDIDCVAKENMKNFIEEYYSPELYKFIEYLANLGSGLVDQSQKMTVAARATAEKKTVGHRS
jgi:hypothetical protein